MSEAEPEVAEPDTPKGPESNAEAAADAEADAADAKSAGAKAGTNADTKVNADPGARNNVDAKADAEAKREGLRKRATDPARRRNARAAANALVDGLAALSGQQITANNLIIGNARVGTLVGQDNHTGTSGPRLVPSGPVSSTWLENLVQTFVPPPTFEKVCDRLRAQPLLLLRAPQGWGRTTAAMSALHRECVAGVHKLNPDVWLPSLDIEFTPDAGYLLETVEIDQLRALQTFHLEQLSRTLTEHRCRLIVVLDDKVEPSPDVEPFLLDGGEPADVGHVVRKHLVRHLHGDEAAVLQLAEVAQLLAYVEEDRLPARDLATLAAELADVARGRIDIADVVERVFTSADSRFRQWFDELDAETRPFTIALAVFNGMPLHIVSTAGRMLARLIVDEETPDDKQTAPSVFGVRSAELLRGARAKSYKSTEETEYGRIPVEAVRFVDDRYPRRILEYVWQEHHAAHELVRDWLHELGNHPDLRVCTRAGVAVGLLSTFEFEHARQLVIEPWADSGERHNQSAAIGALQFPCLEPELAPLVARMLAAWLHRDQPLARRVTATAALGSTFGQLVPNRAIELLRRMARSGEPDIRDAVCYSMIELFKVTELTGQILAELRTWIGSRRPDVRDTGFLCVLQLSFDVDVDTFRGARAWPVMVWLADEMPELRGDIVELFARLMEAQFFVPAAYAEIRRWVCLSETDPQLRGPLGSLLIELGHAIQDTAVVPYYLREWGAERNGPVRAVEVLLTILDSGRAY
ncbi:hypothetical protein ACFU44_11780 [Nocardia rhizosphaerihabitans]|uniref:hypothetical protein n=1 Tax=Nocardia rhizosphaerihabitans TaxID=1691570 RepID=UPI0036708B1A